MKIPTSAFVASCLFLACNQPSNEQPPAATDTPTISSTPIVVVDSASTKTYTTKTGKTIVVKESHPVGASLSTVDLRFAGDSLAAMVFTDIDPVKQILQADLDANGFDEIYIITESAGSGSYGKVYGMASNQDKSLTPVYMAEPSEKDLKAGQPFEGYKGGDRFSISGNELIREFPIEKSGKTKRMIHYNLKAGEASWQLVIKKTMEL